MNILILGSGGREHAFAWKINQSQLCKKLFVAPGNGGTSQVATNVPHLGTHFDEHGKQQVIEFIVEEQIDLLLVGPEAPLVAGLVDDLRARSDLNRLMVVGPDSKGAHLEGSKEFAKHFMQKHGIPTASAKSFTAQNIEEGFRHINSQSLPVVLKADGLAAGKGVVICYDYKEAEDSMKSMLLDHKFGEAGSKVVVETFLNGIELSLFVLTDGDNYVILPEAKDYKRIGENDTGLNTGGMGAVSPVPFADRTFLEKVENKIVKPTIDGLKKEDIDYRGFIFIGLMNVAGEPFVIEYNVRMGDPETQVVIPRIDEDLLPLLIGCATNSLESRPLKTIDHTASTIVLVSEGYPESYEKGKTIIGLKTDDETLVFHAGTKAMGKEIVTNGGRVLAITGMGSDIQEALRLSYSGVKHICWEGLYYRSDIGKDLLN